jgi:hypothetical protein
MEDVKKMGAKETVEVIEVTNHKMIDLVALAKNEPELFDELAADYPAEKSIYVFCVS